MTDGSIPSDIYDAPGSKSRDAYRTISEAAALLDLPHHVLRFWEGKFPQIKPLKRSGNRRYYRPADVETLRAIKQLLHEDGYTIRGVQKLFKEQGLRNTVAMALGLPEPARNAAGADTLPVANEDLVDKKLAQQNGSADNVADTQQKSHISRQSLEDIHAELLALKERILRL